MAPLLRDRDLGQLEFWSVCHLGMSELLDLGSDARRFSLKVEKHPAVPPGFLQFYLFLESFP